MKKIARHAVLAGYGSVDNNKKDNSFEVYFLYNIDIWSWLYDRWIIQNIFNWSKYQSLFWNFIYFDC